MFKEAKFVLKCCYSKPFEVRNNPLRLPRVSKLPDVREESYGVLGLSDVG